MSQFPRLDRLDAMQRAPLGTFSSLRRPSPVATQYKRQSEMYGQALRTLSRAARRGDAGAAMDAIGLRDKANADGYTPGGIRDAQSFQGNIAGREASLATGARDFETAADMNRRSASGLERRAGINPAATPVGRGRDQSTFSATPQDPMSPLDRRTGINPAATPVKRGPTMEFRNWVGVRDGKLGDRTPDDGLDSLTRSQDNNFAPGANVTNPPGGFRTIGNANPDGTSRQFPTTVNPSPAGGVGTLPQERPPQQQGPPMPQYDVSGAPKAKAVGMIDGRPAVDVLAEMRAGEGLVRNAPKAQQLSKTDQYLAEVEAYQAGLSDPRGADAAKAADARATEIYMGASDLEKARMSSALMKRASDLNRSQSSQKTLSRKR